MSTSLSIYFQETRIFYRLRKDSGYLSNEVSDDPEYIEKGYVVDPVEEEGCIA